MLSVKVGQWLLASGGVTNRAVKNRQEVALRDVQMILQIAQMTPADRDASAAARDDFRRAVFQYFDLADLRMQLQQMEKMGGLGGLMGMMPGLKAFVAAVLGGIGIIPGAMLGGIILGVVEAMVSGFFSSTFRDAAAFAILILILLYKPAGILGKNVREKV